MSRKADPSRSDADWSFSRTSLSSQHRAQPPTENFFVRAFLWFFTEPASATELTDKNVGYLDRDIAFEPGSFLLVDDFCKLLTLLQVNHLV